jgi:hypothetical protein
VVRLDWDGATAVVVASGPSAARTPLNLALGRAKVIVVNSSWRLAPWADVLFACDAGWWFHHDGVPEFPGRKFASSPAACRRFGTDLFVTRGSNSGIRAIRLAEHFGAASVLLVGFDMHDKGGTHWHEPHGGVLRNPVAGSMADWVKEIERERHKFKARIVNCTPGSALRCFPLQSFEDAIHGGVNTCRADRQGYSVVLE